MELRLRLPQTQTHTTSHSYNRLSRLHHHHHRGSVRLSLVIKRIAATATAVPHSGVCSLHNGPREAVVVVFVVFVAVQVGSAEAYGSVLSSATIDLDGDARRAAIWEGVVAAAAEAGGGSLHPITPY